MQMQKVGAQLRDMRAISASPMGVEIEGAPGLGVIGSTYMWKAGGICVNKNGERFMNECDPRSADREELLELQPGSVQYDVFTDKIYEDLKAAGASAMYELRFADEKGVGHWLLTSAPTLAELANEIGVPADALQKTVASYNAHVESGEPDEFGHAFDEEFDLFRLCNNKVEGDRYWAAPIRALVNTTPGGIRTDLEQRVVVLTEKPLGREGHAAVAEKPRSRPDPVYRDRATWYNMHQTEARISLTCWRATPYVFRAANPWSGGCGPSRLRRPLTHPLPRVAGPRRAAPRGSSVRAGAACAPHSLPRWPGAPVGARQSRARYTGLRRSPPPRRSPKSLPS